MRFGELASRNGFPRGGSGMQRWVVRAVPHVRLHFKVCVGLSRYDDFFGTGGEATPSTPGREKQKRSRGMVEEEGEGGLEAAEEEEEEEGGEIDAAAAEDGEDGEVEKEVDLKVGVDAFHAPYLACFSADGQEGAGWGSCLGLRRSRCGSKSASRSLSRST